MLVTSFYVFNNEKQMQIVSSLIPSISGHPASQDIKKVTTQSISKVGKFDADDSTARSIFATSNSNILTLSSHEDPKVQPSTKNPITRGDMWHKIDEKATILADTSVQEIQYAFYDFSIEDLELDPIYQEKRRPNSGLPTQEILKEIETANNEKWQFSAEK